MLTEIMKREVKAETKEVATYNDALRKNLFLKVSVVPGYWDMENDWVVLRLPNYITINYSLKYLIFDENFKEIDTYDEALGKKLYIPVKLLTGWECTQINSEGKVTKVTRIRLQSGDVIKVEIDGSGNLVYAKFHEI